jgi:hypothetical protein
MELSAGMCTATSENRTRNSRRQISINIMISMPYVILVYLTMPTDTLYHACIGIQRLSCVEQTTQITEYDKASKCNEKKINSPHGVKSLTRINPALQSPVTNRQLQRTRDVTKTTQSSNAVFENSYDVASACTAYEAVLPEM